MSRKKQVPEESTKRALILKTAQKLFMEQGYAEVSMDALADAVPVSKRTLYNHFHDKKALFTAVMESRCQFISGSIAEILMQEDKSARQVLTETAKQFLSVVLKPQAVNIHRTAIMQVSHFPELGKLFYESGPMRCMGILGDYLSKLHKRGELSIPDTTQAAGVFFSMILGTLQKRLLLGVDKQISQKEIDKHIQYVVDVFLRGQKPD
jgi:TetR/AcrR family transcriptional repressor of mexJK operon